MDVCQGGAGLWLSEWTDNFDDPNRLNKYASLYVYLAIGLGQSILVE